jgi:ATP-dependent metalloprotease FtsH
MRLLILVIGLLTGTSFLQRSSLRFLQRPSLSFLQRSSLSFLQRPSLRFLKPLLCSPRSYPFSQKYYETYLRRLNSKNITMQNKEILGNDDVYERNETQHIFPTGLRIIINNNPFMPNDVRDSEDEDENERYRRMRMPKSKKSENFEVVANSGYTFADVGGYDAIKAELNQCVDLLQNYKKYAQFNVRVPKGLILEGPPGNGKTLLAKAFAGEANCSFIAVSGSEFQEKYVGVGSARIRELFTLAKKATPCIIFIDEIDALGRNRAKDGESSSAERDNTLNELLIALDGFKNTSGVFLVGATNRVDLLDPALIRPGRVDKRIYIGNPDEKTRRAIIKIHSAGKPRNVEIEEDDLVDMTAGFSGAQIENLLNEAMLHALRHDRFLYEIADIETVHNRMLVGWQPTEHEFTNDIVDHIAIHEMGHAVVGLLSKHHANVTKVIINLSAPHSPGYTVFESASSSIYTRESLFEHLTILLAGRVAEEVFYGISVTTGAINDFEEALKLAHKMVLYYGMGNSLIYPMNSEKYKEAVDDEISVLIQQAYDITKVVIEHSKCIVEDLANLLKERKSLDADEIVEYINTNYSDMLEL